MHSNSSTSSSKEVTGGFLHRFSLKQLILCLALLLCAVEIHDQIRVYFKKQRTAQTPAAAFQPVPVQGFYESNGIEYSAEKKNGTFRVLVYGGSAAMGFGINSQKSWWYLMQESLKADTRRDIEIINFAKGAYTSADDYVNFIKHGQYLQADMVIIYNGWNDIAAFAGNPGWITKAADTRLAEAALYTGNTAPQLRSSPISLVRRYYKLKEKLEKNISLFYARLESFRGFIFKKMAAQKWLPQKTFLSNYGLFKETPPSFKEIMTGNDINANYVPLYPLYSDEIKKLYVSHYAKNMASLAAALQERNIKALFVFQPDLLFTASKRPLSAEEEEISGRLLGGNAEKWKEIVKNFYPEGIAIMKNTAEEHGMPFLNMQTASEKYPGTEIFQDNVHYTARGNQIVAKEILKKIRLSKG